MALKDELPQIVKTSLHEESKPVRNLVKFLLAQVMMTEGKRDQEQRVKTALFTEIEKMYNEGLLENREEF